MSLLRNFNETFRIHEYVLGVVNENGFIRLHCNRRIPLPTSCTYLAFMSIGLHTTRD